MYFQRDLNTRKLVAISVDRPLVESARVDTWSHHDIGSYETAQIIAGDASDLTGALWVGVDKGPGIYPRFDVIEAPKVGDKVSYTFNGDYYPDGEVTHVTTGSLRVIKTSTGNTYYRRGNSAQWLRTGGTWSLIPGHHDRRNPEF